jgi:phosphomannomutase
VDRRRRAANRGAPSYDPTVFKAYDIRGVVGRNIDALFAEHLGRAFGSEAWRPARRPWPWGATGACRGRRWWPALIRGLAEHRPGRGGPRRGDHADAVLRGRHARPHGCTSGIQVTGSHNPKDYNGFKMVMSRPRHLRRGHPEGCASASRPRTTRPGKGRSATMDIGAEYSAPHHQRLQGWRGR